METSNKETDKLRQLIDASKKEIEFLNAKARIAGIVAVQKYIDNFEKMKEYDGFANYWASWNAQ